MGYSSKMALIYSLVFVGLISGGSALICRNCDGAVCVSAPTAVNTTCSSTQDTCLWVKFEKYAIRMCAVNSLMCSYSGFQTNLNAQYGEIQNYFTNSFNRAVQASDFTAATMGCCNTDYCNGGMTTTGSLILLVVALGLVLNKN